MDRNNIHVLSRAVVLENNQLLVCQTADLPKNFYFLPGGHVEHGESAEQGLLREMMEETEADCHIKKFLGCLEYGFEPGHSSICHNHEYTFIFQLESDRLKPHLPLSQPLSHLKLIWLPFDAIEEVDFRAEPLKKALPEWLKGKSPQIFCSSFSI